MEETVQHLLKKSIKTFPLLEIYTFHPRLTKHSPIENTANRINHCKYPAKVRESEFIVVADRIKIANKATVPTDSYGRKTDIDENRWRYLNTWKTKMEWKRKWIICYEMDLDFLCTLTYTEIHRPSTREVIGGIHVFSANYRGHCTISGAIIISNNEP